MDRLDSWLLHFSNIITCTILSFEFSVTQKRSGRKIWFRKHIFETIKLGNVVSNFSFSHSVFCLFGELSCIFNKFEILVCKFFQFRRVQNLQFGKGLNDDFCLSYAIELCGKRRKCWLSAFSPFPTMFQKSSLLSSLQVLFVWQRVNLYMSGQ